MKDNLVIVRYAKAPEFWTGSQWSREYPDALKLTQIHHARLLHLPPSPAWWEIVRDYGMEDQTTVAYFEDGRIIRLRQPAPRHRNR